MPLMCHRTQEMSEGLSLDKSWKQWSPEDLGNGSQYRLVSAPLQNQGLQQIFPAVTSLWDKQYLIGWAKGRRPTTAPFFMTQDEQRSSTKESEVLLPEEWRVDALSIQHGTRKPHGPAWGF